MTADRYFRQHICMLLISICRGGFLKFSQGLLLVFVWRVDEDSLSLRHQLLMQRYEKGGNDDGTDLHSVGESV